MFYLKSSIQKFHSALNKIISHELKLVDSNDSNFLNYGKKKEFYYITLYKTSFQELINSIQKLDISGSDKELVSKIKSTLPDLQNSFETNDFEKLTKIINQLADLDSKLIYKKEPSSGNIILGFKIQKLPVEIVSEVNADLKELEKCFASDCYRASIILCGRILETTLHRKFFDSTGTDLLEKSPGIGLGTLVAKLKEKNVSLDPAIMQQIHLINQVRIYSVHMKKESFNPSKEQTQAIILYTLDIVRKLIE